MPPPRAGSRGWPFSPPWAEERPSSPSATLARASGLGTAFVRELMQAAGRPNPGRGERAFSRDDVDLAKLIGGFLDAGLPRSELLEVLRVLSRGMAQTADATRLLVGNALLERGVSQDEIALRYIAATERLVPEVTELLRLQLLAHLRTGISQRLVTDAERDTGRLTESRDIAVAFADLVGYTRLGGQLPPEDVGRIAGRLGELAADTVRRPVTLVKMIGDAAMFVSEDADALVTVVERLTQRIAAEGPDFPGVRAGIAFGPATTRGGDWFGATVNLASRVAGLAKPGEILGHGGGRAARHRRHLGATPAAAQGQGHRRTRAAVRPRAAGLRLGRAVAPAASRG